MSGELRLHYVHRTLRRTDNCLGRLSDYLSRAAEQLSRRMTFSAYD